MGLSIIPRFDRRPTAPGRTVTASSPLRGHAPHAASRLVVPFPAAGGGFDQRASDPQANGARRGEERVVVHALEITYVA